MKPEKEKQTEIVIRVKNRALFLFLAPLLLYIVFIIGVTPLLLLRFYYAWVDRYVSLYDARTKLMVSQIQVSQNKN